MFWKVIICFKASTSQVLQMEERRFERNMGELVTSKACTRELCEHLGLSMSMLWSASKAVCLCHGVQGKVG